MGDDGWVGRRGPPPALFDLPIPRSTSGMWPTWVQLESETWETTPSAKQPHGTPFAVRGCEGLGSPGVISECPSRRVGRGSECSVVASITYTHSSDVTKGHTDGQLDGEGSGREGALKNRRGARPRAAEEEEPQRAEATASRSAGKVACGPRVVLIAAPFHLP